MNRHPPEGSAVARVAVRVGAAEGELRFRAVQREQPLLHRPGLGQGEDHRPLGAHQRRSHRGQQTGEWLLAERAPRRVPAPHLDAARAASLGEVGPGSLGMERMGQHRQPSKLQHRPHRRGNFFSVGQRAPAAHVRQVSEGRARLLATDQEHTLLTRRRRELARVVVGEDHEVEPRRTGCEGDVGRAPPSVAPGGVHVPCAAELPRGGRRRQRERAHRGQQREPPQRQDQQPEHPAEDAIHPGVFLRRRMAGAPCSDASPGGPRRRRGRVLERPGLGVPAAAERGAPRGSPPPPPARPPARGCVPRGRWSAAGGR